MKRVGIILTAVAFLFAFAAPLFAVEADWTGEFTFGGITGFDAEQKLNNAYGNAYFDATLAIDDYNSVLFEFAGVLDPTATTPNWWELGALFLETDLGAYVGLPVGLMSKAGYYNFDMRDYAVTGLAYELDQPETGAANQFKFNIDADMVVFDVAWSMDAPTAGVANNDYAVMMTLPEVGPASAQVGYFMDSEFTGTLGVNVQALGIADMVDFAGGFFYDTADAAAPAWWWGAGVAASYNIAKLGVSVNGMEDQALSVLGIDLNVEQGDIGADVGTALNLYDGAPETFGGIDVSVYYTPGASKWRVGYLYENDGSFFYNAPALNGSGIAGEGGGLYFGCDIDI